MRLACSCRSAVVHVRSRSSRLAAPGGLCNWPRRGPSRDAQPAPASAAVPAPAQGFSSPGRVVSVRRLSGRRTTVIRRTDVRSRSVVGEDPTTPLFNSLPLPNSLPRVNPLPLSLSNPLPLPRVNPTRTNGRLVGAVQWYQRAAQLRPSPCRFSPSCSCYAVEALQTHGTPRGLWLTLRRLVRCRPFGPSGYDPVPDVVHPTLPPTPYLPRKGE